MRKFVGLGLYRLIVCHVASTDTAPLRGQGTSSRVKGFQLSAVSHLWFADYAYQAQDYHKPTSIAARLCKSL